MRDARHIDEMAADALRDVAVLRSIMERDLVSPDAFPVTVFPAAIRDYVSEAAEAYGIPLSMLGSGVLAVAAGIIGKCCELQIKRLHRERAILWLVLIGGPGSGKSPALSIVRKPLDVIQARYAAAYAAELAAWDELPKPDQRTTPRPTMRSIYTTNATIEAVASMVARSPGVVVLSDELVSWVVMMSKYQSSGSSRSDWLTLWSGAPLKSDRKMAASVFVQRPCVSVVGGMQPDLLHMLRQENGFDDGSLDRTLPVWPAPRRRTYSEREISSATISDYLDRMLTLDDMASEDEPLILTFSPAAKRIFVAWFNENAATNTDGFSAKGDRHIARLALILHLLHHGPGGDTALSEATISDAITLFEFFRGEHNRMLAAIGAGLGGRGTSPAVRLRTRVLGFLTDAGEDGLARTAIHTKLRGNTTADDLTFVLSGLEDEGLATKTMVATGHRPRETWAIVQRSYEETNQSTPAAIPTAITSYSRTQNGPDDDRVVF